MTSSQPQPVQVEPFSLPGNWYRGILHVHSTLSDGERAPDEVLAWYRARGYHFVALTDHDVLSQGRPLAEDFVTLSGIEVECVDPEAGLYHLLGFGAERPPDLTYNQLLPLQEGVDRLRAVARVVVVAHPYWSGQRSADLLALERCSLLEVYNGGCDVDDAKGYSAVHWDDLLAAGRRWRALATDDAHWRSGTKDAGLGWVWVRAPHLEAEALLGALEKGHFYASTGPKIDHLEVEGRQVRVRCSPATAVDFVGNGPFSRRISAPPGGVLTEAAHTASGRQTYVRVAVRDAGGNWAWANPIWFQPGG
ncbi:MAG: PHP domain-containing protein [Chloroflexi bacterium]|nr:MAG: PHP domain-containing protein [Chloroflexota bacterium]